MKFNREDLESLDIDWFSVDSQENIAQFAVAGCGFVPQSVMTSVENNDRLLDYFFSLAKGRSSVKFMEKNLPDFQDEKGREFYLSSFVNFASCGLFSYDVIDLEPGTGKAYKLIAAPEIPLKLEALPASIKDLLLLTNYACGVFNENHVIKSGDIE